MEKGCIDILIVDDNDDDSMLIEDAFADDSNMNVVHIVRDGEEALQFLRREGRFADAKRPGLVLLDINMPKKDGFEVLKEMKADPVLRFIPVVMLTTSEREEDIVRSYTAGACSYITKPTDFEKFAETLRTFSPYWSSVATVPPNR